MIITSCKDCKFANFINNEQVGCNKNRLGKFKSIGIATQLIENGDLKYYMIDELCNYCVNKDSYNETPMPETKLYEMTRFRVDWIVVDEDNENFMTIYNKILLILHHAIYDRIRPDRIIYVISNNNVLSNTERYQLYEMMTDMLKGTNIIYSLSFGVEDRDFWQSIESVIHNVKSPYFSIWQSGYNIPNNFNYNLDLIINEELRDFTIFDGIDSKNGVTYKTSVAKPLVANLRASGKNIECLPESINEDFKNADDYNKRKHLIKKEEIYG